VNDEVTDLVPGQNTDEARLRRAETFRYSRHDSWSAPVDPKRCRASVSEGGRSVRMHQCRQAAKFPTVPGGPVEWCRTHAPETRLAKQAKWEAKYQRERAGIDRRERIRALAVEVCDALLDPARLQEAIDKARDRKALIDQEGQVHG
jgi:hypothetical protein